ncbi:hypothetical protein MVEG_08349 [Podila verticillata NRRL 6337]|nr:hypothetical protein MVEG_08349 [Podila verticillata NRRL 6337]
MSPMHRSHPLETPELLSLIGSFVTLWQGSPSRPKFMPKDVVSCTMVSKSWREAMLPHLWAVYHHDSMVSARVPIKLLFKYSAYFRFFEPPDHHARGVWRTDTTGQSLFQCTMVKHFFITASTSLQTQILLLYKNFRVQSLHWQGFQSMKLRGSIADTVQPFAASIKSLHLEKGKYTEPELIMLLNCFPHLERLIISRSLRRKPTQPSNPPAAQGALRLTGLKSLSISSGFDEEEYSTIMSILSHNPAIDHIDLNALISERGSQPESLLDTLFDLRQQVLDQRDQGPSLPQGSAQGPKELRFRVTKGNHTMAQYAEMQCNMQFENQGRDIVALSVILQKNDADVLFPRLTACTNHLRRLDIECRWRNDGDDTGVLTEVLSHFSALRHLRFVSFDGLSSEGSNSVFQLPERSGQNSRRSIKTTAAVRGLVWACQDSLEHLDLTGLWKTAKNHHSQDDWSFMAASPGHQWVARDKIHFGSTVQNMVAQRVQSLPHLQTLTLQGVTFNYCRVDKLSEPSA